MQQTSASLLFQSHNDVFSMGMNPRAAATEGNPAYGAIWPSPVVGSMKGFLTLASHDLKLLLLNKSTTLPPSIM